MNLQLKFNFSFPFILYIYFVFVLIVSWFLGILVLECKVLIVKFERQWPTHPHTISTIYILLGCNRRSEMSFFLIICRDVNGPRDCHTVCEVREKQISYINGYMWNLETRYKWTYLQSEIETQRQRTDIWVQGGKGGGWTGRLGLARVHYWYCA